MEPAAEPDVVDQVRAFTEWVGTGRKLTQTGRITMSDARMLVTALNTGDELDREIGGHVYRTKSSQELPGLTLIVEWAKAVRLVRKTGNKLVRVKKNAALLDDAPALRHALFAVFDQLGEAFLNSGFSESLMRSEFAPCVRAMFTSLHHAGGPVAAEDLRMLTWRFASAPYVLDDATEFQLEIARGCNDRDTTRTLETLRRLGVVALSNDTVELTEFGRDEVRRSLGEPAPGDPVLQVKITLLDTGDLPVWRRVLVPASVRLDHLHEVVQAMMGWQNYHLHAFVDGQTYYGVPDPDLGYRDEHETTLDDLVKPGGQLLYVYDFGDNWEHEITVEDEIVAEPGMRYPLCVAGAGACPPEDCGGAPGYEHLVAVLADPGHPEHRDKLDWLGLDDPHRFDPARFTPDDANQRLAELLHSPFRTSWH